MEDRSKPDTLSHSLEIGLLRSFIVVAEVRALNRAANRIGQTQSALGQQMQRLELKLQ